LLGGFVDDELAGDDELEDAESPEGELLAGLPFDPSFDSFDSFDSFEPFESFESFDSLEL
jgi:hypothetical protein